MRAFTVPSLIGATVLRRVGDRPDFSLSLPSRSRLLDPSPWVAIGRSFCYRPLEYPNTTFAVSTTVLPFKMFVCDCCSLIFFSARAFFSHKRSCNSDNDIRQSYPFTANPNADDDVDWDDSCSPIADHSTLLHTSPDFHEATSTESSHGATNFIHESESFQQDSPHSCRCTSLATISHRRDRSRGRKTGDGGWCCRS